MNVLVIGGKGFLGRQCTNVLMRLHNVYVVDRIDCNEKNSYKAEIRNIAAIKKIVEDNKIDCILHFVSSMIPSSDVSEYRTDIENIYIPTIELLEYCATKNVRFVYLSSGALYMEANEKYSMSIQKGVR